MRVFIDDATSRVTYARLVPVERTQVHFSGMRGPLLRYGKPLASYSDPNSIFRVNRWDGKTEPTQVERALTALDTELICTHSPQANGRVERGHLAPPHDRGTLGKRLTVVVRDSHTALWSGSVLPVCGLRYPNLACGGA